MSRNLDNGSRNAPLRRVNGKTASRRGALPKMARAGEGGSCRLGWRRARLPKASPRPPDGRGETGAAQGEGQGEKRVRGARAGHPPAAPG